MELFSVLLVLGLVVGFIGGYAGIGGAPFLISFLVIVLGIPQLAAQGSVLTMMMGPMSLLGLLTMKKEVKAQLKNIIIGVVSYALFSYFGALIAFHIGDSLLKIYFSFLLILVALLHLFTKEIDSDTKLKKNISSSSMTIVGIFTGIIGGIFGIGAGVLMVPVFISFFKLKKNYARALSLGILLPPVSIGAFIKYNHENVINWQIVIILFISYFISNYFGAKVGQKSSFSLFKKAYAFLLVVIATIYFFG